MAVTKQAVIQNAVTNNKKAVPLTEKAVQLVVVDGRLVPDHVDVNPGVRQ